MIDTSTVATESFIATCHGKARFDSPALANKASRRSRRSHHEAITPYHCDHCGGWHLGTKGIGRSRAARNTAVKINGFRGRA